jgi:hypothetical protein
MFVFLSEWSCSFLVGLRYPGYDENAEGYHSEKRKRKRRNFED